MRVKSALASLVLGLSTLGALALPEVAEAKNVFPWNHPDLDWYTIETKHFYVHYPVSKKTKEQGNKHYINDEWAARRVAKVADEMWDPMCRQFDYYLTEKVHIVILEQSDDLEGFTIPAWNWIEISGNPGGYFYRMRGRMEWFSDVLVHEFAHVVSLKRQASLAEGTGGVLIGGLYRDGLHDQDSGAEFNVGETQPFWWTEGGAEYWSDNAGYNWWTPARDMNIRTTVLDDRLLTYDEWTTVIEKRDWDDGERGYQQGYSFGQYLRQRFGNDTYQRFAQVSSQEWRAQWENIVQEVTGVPLRQLYDDWVAYLKVKYQKQVDDVTAQGLATGGELEQSTGEWVVNDPAAKDKYLTDTLMQNKKDGKKPKFTNRKWKYRARRDREIEREKTGRWEFYPRQSPDGKWFGEDATGLYQFYQYPEDLFPAVAGQDPNTGDTASIQRAMGSSQLSVYDDGAAFSHSYDFVPGKDAAVVTGQQDDKTIHHAMPWTHLETDGYDWLQLYVVDLSATPPDKLPHGKKGHQKHHGAKETKLTHESRQFNLFTKNGSPLDWWRYKAIPNTERGSDPAVSPDGTRVAYFEYAAGTLNLVSIGIDGSDKKYLTDFHDGTWLQNVDWSPDGKQLVFSMIRNFDQDLYVVDADGKNLHALNRDPWEDQDPFWAPDGSIWFSSDPTGFYNVYRFDPKTAKVEQITNVTGGAECPWVTTEGNLLYTNFTAFGWKNYVLSKADFVHQDATDRFSFDMTPEQKAESEQILAYSEDLSYWKDTTTKYHTWKSWMAPTAVPMFRLENDSLTNFGLSAGGQIYAQDFVEKNTFFAQVLVGEDPIGIVGYTYNGWYPSITVQAYHYESKYDYGFMLDADKDNTTTDDQTTFEGKQHQYVNVVAGFIDYPFNESLDVNLYGRGLEYGFKGTSDTAFKPYFRSAEGGLHALLSNAPTYAQANFGFAHAAELTLSHGFSDIVYPDYHGYDTDDGQVLDKYQYNKIEGRYTLHAPVPHFWIPALKTLRDHRHTLQWDTQIGLVDRNVHLLDEFRGGGQHPYYTGPGSLQPNSQFAGYPFYSLAGETEIVTSLEYRFPLVRELNKKSGPFYLYDVFAQFGGTTGNFWSYRPPDESETGKYYYDSQGQRVAYDPSDVRREIPFVDTAYKNGNYLLFDANAEIRVAATLWGQYGWNSFFRVAYGFNRIHGVGDVNGDDIQDTTETGFGNALSNETENPGPRFYLGIGTGW